MFVPFILFCSHEVALSADMIDMTVSECFFFGFLTVKDGQWSNWYGTNDSAETLHTIEGSLDTDSMREICVGIGENGGECVGAIKATFDSGYTSGWIGSSRDTETCFVLSTGEYITDVSFKYEATYGVFRMLQFTSSSGYAYGPYGNTTAAATDTVSGGTDEGLFKMEIFTDPISDGIGITGLRFFFVDGVYFFLSLSLFVVSGYFEMLSFVAALKTSNLVDCLEVLSVANKWLAVL